MKLPKIGYFYKMKKIIKATLFLVFLLSLTSMSVHKFYVSVNQIDFVPKKKALEITSRIFIDDLDLALEKKFKKKVYLATLKETSDAKELLQKYFAEKFSIKVNGQQKQLNFLGKEVEENVLICYFTIKDVSKVSSLEIRSTVLMELYEQQHIFHCSVSGKKQSLLLTNGTSSGVLNYWEIFLLTNKLSTFQP